MTVVNNVFPQSGDADFAENFATWLGRGNISDYVETGLSFTVDYGAAPPTVDISEGKSYIIVDETTISSNNETRLLLDYAITTDGTTGLSLNGSEENNLVYLNPNVGSNDSPTFEVETVSGNAGATWLLIGRIDTVSDTSERLNRNPDSDFDNLSARQSLDLPTYSEFSEADSSESSTIYIDGNGSVDAGIYVNDGTGYVSAGVREINKLVDVDGVESVTSDTSANRPSAGTQGALFIDETNEKIQLDTGAAWVDIGINSNNIGAGDLGFDPATQTELNNHAADVDIHHTRPTAGNGLKDQSDTFNIEPSDFAGLFLNDNSDNLEVQIGFGLEDDGSGQIQFDEDATYTFPNQQIINGILTMGADIDLSNNNLVEPNQLQTSGSGSDVITVQDTNAATSIMTFAEGGEVAVTSGDLTDGGLTTIYDQSASHIPLATLEQDSVTINANDGLKSGGTVTLGGSVGLDIEPTDFAGAFLSDDGTDNLQVDISTGVEDDGTGSIRVDEDFDFTFTSAIDFSAGLDVQGDITDGTQVIWDVSAQEVPDSALGSVDNTTLTNDSITINANDGLVGGGTVALGGSVGFDIEPADFAGSFLADDGADNLQVRIGSGLENDGTNRIQVDEGANFEFGQEIVFGGGLSFGDADADTNTWSVDENATSGNFAISESVAGVVTDVDSSGNIRTEGELTEGASL